MGDLISKQDAVNISLEFFVEFLGGALHENAQKELITRFQRFPSAHPELDEWCTDCKEYDHEKHCCPRYNRVIREAVEEIQVERKKGKWLLTDTMYACNKCHSVFYEISQFCPNCGAEMKGEE